MRYKRSIIIGASVAILGITGISAAATHSEPSTVIKPVNKVQSKPIDSTQEPLPVTVEVGPSEPVAASAATVSADTTPSDTTQAATDPIEVFHQAVLAKATTIYPYAHTSGQTLDNFLWAQYWCILDRIPDKSSITQEQLNTRLSFFDPIGVNPDGTPRYQYFDGACKVYTT